MVVANEKDALHACRRPAVLFSKINTDIDSGSIHSILPTISMAVPVLQSSRYISEQDTFA